MNINKYGQPVGFPLPDWQPLAFPPRTQLSGRHCNLLPLETRHGEALFQAYSLTEDDRDWTWLGAEKPASLAEMMLWITGKVNDFSLVSWGVADIKNNRPVGVVCYSNVDPVNGAMEIGHVTWSPLMQKTSMGTEALFLLMKNAFTLGYRRIAWRCDSLNQASRNAAERVGFTFEGRFRQAMTRKQRNRDTDWLSVIDTDWPNIERALEGWLSLENFNQNGAQKRRLETFFLDSR